MNRLVAFGLGFAALSSAMAEPLSWDQCVKQAARSNPDLLAAQKVVAAWEDNVRNATSPFFPDISGSLGYTTSHNYTLAGSPFDTSGYSAGILANQNLFSGFADKARRDQVRAKRERAEVDLVETRARISYELKSAFASLAFSQSSISLLETIVQRRESDTKLVQLRYRSGAENKGSVMLADAQLEQARLDLAQAKMSLVTSQTDLARVLGWDHADELVVTGDVPVTPPPAGADFRALSEKVPGYLKSVASVHEAEASIQLARSGYFPTLTVSAGTHADGVTFFPRDNSNLSFGVAVTIPLFSGGRDYWGTLSAVESHTAATLRQENERRTSTTRLRDIFTAYVIAARKVELDRQFLDAATVRSRIAREKYNNGLMTFEDWDIIENEFISHQKQLLDSQRLRVLAEANWEQVRGEGVLR